MLSSLRLQNFKCFAAQSIALRPLTLLSGQNGMGKSTVIQSLLLIRQSYLTAMLPQHGLVLNGPLLRVGTVQDLLYDGAQEDVVEIAVTSEAREGYAEHTSEWKFDASSKGSDVLGIASAATPEPNYAGFQYLAAERIGPRDVHDVSEYQVNELRDVSSHGIYAVAYLDAHASDSVLEAMCRFDAASDSLLAQTNAWMGEVSPGVRLAASRHREANRATLSVAFSSGRATSNTFRPTNVGFGLSYTLPVVVKLLSVRPNDLVLVENPEAHLHPRGQMAMGELMARAALGGAQVLVETHSDHVLNGVRLAVKRGLLSHRDVALHYFDRADDGEQVARVVHRVDSPRIDRDGRIDRWPPGFFDQWDVALDQLL